MNRTFYWIKLKTDFFRREEIDFLLSQKMELNTLCYIK